jgi:RNA polymerase sigma-70 factor (ECF subfamily)
MGPAPENYKDLEIVKCIQEGNHKAFECIFKEYYTRLCVYSKKFTLQREVAEEIVQQIFSNIWENKEELSIHTSIKSYLFRAVHNNSLKYLNSKKFEEDYKIFNESILLDNSDIQPDFDLSENLYKSIEDLPPQCRKIFILSRFEQYKHNEIAEKLGISAKTVEVQIRRANISLRKKLQYFLPIIFVFSIVRDFLIERIL